MPAGALASGIVAGSDIIIVIEPPKSRFVAPENPPAPTSRPGPATPAAHATRGMPDPENAGSPAPTAQTSRILPATHLPPSNFPAASFQLYFPTPSGRPPWRAPRPVSYT